jgi:uncharacterized protein (TIGR03083 family)
MKRTDIARAVEEERETLLADLRNLAPADWNTPSLCSEWTVAEVAAHLARVGDFYRRPYTFEWDLLRHGFRLNRALSEVAKRMAAGRSPAEVLDRLERATYERTLTFRLHPQPRFALSEWIVHGQDIRRPLGIPATFAPQRLIATVEAGMKWYAWGARDRRLRMRLEATDADWSAGAGPVYRGPMEAITMVVLGRLAAMDDLVLVS